MSVARNTDGEFALRLKRYGKWESLWFHEITYLTDQEFADLRPNVKSAVFERMLNENWDYDMQDCVFRRPHTPNEDTDHE